MYLCLILRSKIYKKAVRCIFMDTTAKEKGGNVVILQLKVLHVSECGV